MRTNATLEAEQKGTGIIPAVTVQYYDGGWIDLSSSITQVNYDEEPYGISVEIHIDNSSGTMDDIAFITAQVAVGLGANCSGTVQVSTVPHVWCYATDKISAPGNAEVVLYCEGAMNRLARWTNDSTVSYTSSADHVYSNVYAFNFPNTLAEIQDLTTKDCIDWLCSKAGVTLGTDISLDSYTDVVKPRWMLKPNETAFDGVRFLLANHSACVLKPDGAELRLMYPQTTDSTVYTYCNPTSAGTHTASINQARTTIMPYQKVIYYSVDSTGGTYSGTATHPSWTSGMGQVSVFDDTYAATSSSACGFMASAILSRAEMESESGVIFAPIANCLQDLYDKVTATDNRTGAHITGGRIGGLYYRYHPKERQYNLTIRIGGAGGNASPPVEPLIPDPPPEIDGSYIKPWTIEPDALRKAGQAYTTEITFNTAAMDWDSVIWSAGTIHFQDQTELLVSGGTLNLANDTPTWLYFTENSATLSNTVDFGVCLAKDKGIVALCQRATADDQKALVLPASGKAPLLNSIVLCANIILAEHIKAGVIETSKLGVGVTSRMFSSTANAANIQAWCSTADATYIDGGNIYTNTVNFSKLRGMPTANMIDNGSFEADRSGWVVHTGTDDWGVLTSNPKHGLKYIACAGGSEIRALRWDTPIYVDENDIIALESWMAFDSGANGSAGIGFVPYDSGGTPLADQITSWASTAFVSGTWTRKTTSLKCPTGTYYIKPVIFLLADNTGGIWNWDDLSLYKSSQIIVHGTTGAQRVEINGSGVYGYGSGNTVQFSLQTTDGKAMCGAGAVIMDADGIRRDSPVVTDSDYLINEAIGGGQSKSASYSLEKMGIYAVSCLFECTSATTDNWRGYLGIRDSNGVTVAYTYHNNAGAARSEFVCGYAGPSSGGSAPIVLAQITNYTGSTETFRAWAKVTRLI